MPAVIGASGPLLLPQVYGGPVGLTVPRSPFLPLLGTSGLYSDHDSCLLSLHSLRFDYYVTWMTVSFLATLASGSYGRRTPLPILVAIREPNSP